MTLKSLYVTSKARKSITWQNKTITYNCLQNVLCIRIIWPSVIIKH